MAIQIARKLRCPILVDNPVKKGGANGMKTFSLKSLMILEQIDQHVTEKHIPLVDGLILNREDGQDRWLIEAYVDVSHKAYFETLQWKEDLMIQVKITKESNEPATFLTSIIGVNMIGQKMNILFLGKIVDVRRGEAQAVLKELVHEGYEGEKLIKRFQQKMKRKERNRA